MACALTQGFVVGCRDSIGGGGTLYVMELANVDSVTEAAGVISLIDKATGKRFWKYELQKFTASYTETGTFSTENGTRFYKQDAKFVINKMDVNARNELMLLASNLLVAVFVDNNGNNWYLGRENGLDVTEDTGGTGTAAGDRNGYTITLTGMEREKAPTVNDTAMATLETPGT